MERKPKATFSAARRWLIGLNVLVAAVAILGLVVMANYLGSGYFRRVQWTSHRRLQLSNQTIKLLQSITNDVTATIFFDSHREPEIYGWVSGMLKEYSYISPRVILKTIDYSRFPGNAELFLAKYKLSSLKEQNFIFFDCAGRTKIVNANELADYNINEVLSGQAKELRRAAFKGEMLFTSAIFSVTWSRPQRAYFVFGHGEHPPDDAGVDPDHGYSRFAAILRDENNVTWAKLSLGGTNDIPADCQLLIIAGPRKSLFSESELEKVDSYLRQGGRILVLMNNLAWGSNTGIEKVLAKWGIGVASNTLYEDKTFSPTGTDLFTAELNPQHPVMKPLAVEELQVRLVLPRAVGQLQGATQRAGAPKVDILAQTSKNAVSHQQVRTTTGIDTRKQTNAFPLMVAVEQGAITGVSSERGATRMIVVGDSLCLDNQVIEHPPNHYFAGLAINWLLDRPKVMLAGLGPMPVRQYKLLVTPSQVQTLNWIFLAAYPGAILIVGGLVWLRRRS